MADGNASLLPQFKWRIWRGLRRLDACNAILPQRCALCLRPDPNGYCHDCQTLLPWIGVACERCARSLVEPGLCGQCQSIPVYRHIVVPFRYLNPVSAHIHALKYEDKLSLAPALARMLALYIISRCDTLPEVLIPVPLHTRRIRRRGFNQSALIANALGALLGIAVDHQYLERGRDTPSQTDLDEAARTRNMRGAFRIHHERRYNSIAVVDDVVTSGATVTSVCETIRRAGCREITVFAVAKT